ncbi:MAG TPA: bifunctional adenosylcobinamide kinase/adenosylcobinamide-phosphate guanylyltransferase [Gemmatimonadales bacterium]|nr:bifunctional adenosylcobinamide kinase/adenosylcobinamide-phosphate guanylyltransferase [Gemmatimonadales bacterium]
MASRRFLVTGGIRSGKSEFAERLLTDQPKVTYIAPGPLPDPATDLEWAARIEAHRRRRPPGWTTMETSDVAAVLQTAEPPFLIDCLGTWLTTAIDRLGVWDQPLDEWQGAFDSHAQELIKAWQSCQGLAVAVTNEVGWGLVSEHRSGRVFSDLLGQLNSAIAAVSDEVYLMVAGRPLRI